MTWRFATDDLYRILSPQTLTWHDQKSWCLLTGLLDVNQVIEKGKPEAVLYLEDVDEDITIRSIKYVNANQQIFVFCFRDKVYVLHTQLKLLFVHRDEPRWESYFVFGRSYHYSNQTIVKRETQRNLDWLITGEEPELNMYW